MATYMSPDKFEILHSATNVHGKFGQRAPCRAANGTLTEQTRAFCEQLVDADSSDLSSDESFLSDESSDDDDDDDYKMEMVHLMHQRCLLEMKRIYGHVVNDNIDFGRRPLKVADINESLAQSTFRYRRDDLQLFMDALWPRLSPHLEGTRQSIICKGYSTPYETGMLILLHRLHLQERASATMEAFYCMRKSKLSAVINTFLSAMYELALPSHPCRSGRRLRFLYLRKVDRRQG
jgi:hypothetical protein